MLIGVNLLVISSINMFRQGLVMVSTSIPHRSTGTHSLDVPLPAVKRSSIYMGAFDNVSSKLEMFRVVVVRCRGAEINILLQ